MYKLDTQLQQDTVRLGQFKLCDVLLMNDSQFPWVILVPRRSTTSELYQLSTEERYLQSDESAYVSQRLDDYFEADSMNIAALGNVVPQLHIHHVVRKKSDPCWPKPIWGAIDPVPYSKEALEKMVDELTLLFSDKFVTPSANDGDALY
ncbi:HIT domain-containing protein [Bermanella sp. WJH001]|uniref:HIT domain-containing protein n=1 Tax=Bermanella sp. WJH001 TaxID=3048005 RepID=UPI0024BE19D5|nr:HIT domain-containing protein [Bermanella sp. WJH001]MDJ1537718.1 HIT domain-containing protein [Bermanella sp. WJH001]